MEVPPKIRIIITMPQSLRVGTLFTSDGTPTRVAVMAELLEGLGSGGLLLPTVTVFVITPVTPGIATIRIGKDPEIVVVILPKEQRIICV